tara:strand:- start:1796 stop:2632 length:837 start_codon:yes stop_codon:yes gene_type:complete
MTHPRLGILSGSGQLVKDVVHSCEKRDQSYFLLGFEGQSERDFIERHPHAWSTLGKIGKSLKLLKEAGVEQIVMAGRIHRPSWSEIRPDSTGALWLAQIARKALGDDALLRFLIDKLEKEGFKVVSAESIIGNTLLAPEGILGDAHPDEQALRDIKRGQSVLKSLSCEDVGQAIVVQEGIVLGIEAFEGTDELIRRTGTYRSWEGAHPVLVKTCKVNQDLRADRPAIGPRTIELLSKAGFAGVSFESQGVILLEQEKLIKLANQKNIFLIGSPPDDKD